MTTVVFNVPNWIGWVLLLLCVLTLADTLMETLRIIIERRVHRRLTGELRQLIRAHHAAASSPNPPPRKP